MAKSFAENVAETSSTIGTDPYELAGAVLGARTFSGAGFVTGDMPFYCVRNRQNTKYEYNKNAIFTDAVVDTLARGTWLSSNSNNPVVWGTQDLPLTIFIPTPSELLEALWKYWTGTVLQLPGTSVTTRVQTASTAHPAAAAIPLDNSIPQVTEGTALVQYDLAFNVQKATSKIRLKAVLHVSHDSALNTVVLCVFLNAGANAVALASAFTPIAQVLVPVVLDAEIANPGVGAHTLKLRIGSVSGTGNFTVNGYNNAAVWGGTLFSSFEVIETFV